MEATSFLIFRLRDSRYAVEASAAREIVFLPEITPLEETPDYVIGVVNLRGQIVPVIDLDLRFGHPPQRPRLEDCVVVLEWAGSAAGIVVSEALNTRDIAPEEIAPLPAYGTASQSEFPFLTGLVKSGEQIVMLLHLENLLRHSPLLAEWQSEGEVAPSAPTGAFCADATPEERLVFQERARSLAQLPEREAQADLLPFAVVRLGAEFFGIALHTVQEFADLRSVTPVPCCPEHIVGQMNLRGDLITLIDVARALGLPRAPVQAERKVVVVYDANLGAGVLVDEILDILTLRPADIAPASMAHAPDREYRRGAAAYGAQMLSLLDLPELLRQESLLVNERP